MPAVLDSPNPSADVRAGQVLTYDQLREEAVEAADEYGGLYQELAEELGVTPHSLSRALNNSGGRYAKLQRRIIQRVRPHYAFAEVGGFLVKRAE